MVVNLPCIISFDIKLKNHTIGHKSPENIVCMVNSFIFGFNSYFFLIAIR